MCRVLMQGWFLLIALVSVVKGDDPELFDGVIREVHIEVSRPEWKRLEEDPRRYVRADFVLHSEERLRSVAIKVKGSAGSWSDPNDRPALTVNTDEFRKKQKFLKHGKFHFNNSQQDSSLLNEWLSCEILRTAGLPAPHVTHIFVSLQGKPLGLYVVKEGFTADFLKRSFGNSSGNLYEGGFVQDIDIDLEKDSGDGVDDRSDLRKLSDACLIENPVDRFREIEKHLDVDAFLRFTACELLLGHWDGYTQNQNNYRIYFEPQSSKAYFLAHGLDQVFGDPAASVLDFPRTIVASAVMSNPSWRKQFRNRLNAELKRLEESSELWERFRKKQDSIQEALKLRNAEMAQIQFEAAERLFSAIEERLAYLKEHLKSEDPRPTLFDESNVVDLNEWYPNGEYGAIEFPERNGENPKQNYEIKIVEEGEAKGSWRHHLFLSKGKYRLSFEARLTGFKPIDEKSEQSGLVMRYGRSEAIWRTVENGPWKRHEIEFEILDDLKDFELVFELQAKGGRVAMKGESARLEKLD